MIELTATAILTGLGLWLLFGAVSFVSYALIRGRLRRLYPGQSSALLLCWLALPFLGSLLISTLLYWPELAMWLVDRHCHADSCRQHGPSTPLALLPAIGLFGWVLFRVLRCYQQQCLPARRLGQQLMDLASPRADYYELPSAAPAAFTLGWLRPRIFITRGLREQCEPNDIACIVDHEQGHRQRQDNLRHLLAWLLTAPLPQRWVRNILDDHRLGCEQACDLIACRRQPREDVADTLLRVARLQGDQHSPMGSSAFVSNHTELRIRALLGEPPEQLSGSSLLVLSGSLLLLIVLLVNPIHNLLERFQ
jgi:hypothetical protein